MNTETHLILAALAGIAVIVGLITLLRVHPFLSLLAGALVSGLVAGRSASETLTSFTTGFGSTSAGVGILVALGAIFGKLLSDTGGADRIVDTLVGRASPRALPWVMALVGAVIGLPMFFEVGLVLLVPVILLVARRSGQPLMRIAVPTLAGLSALHGLVPPHPGPLAAIDGLHANLGLTLGLGVLVAIPTVIVAGPLLSHVVVRWVPVLAPAFVGGQAEHAATGASRDRAANAEHATSGEATATATATAVASAESAALPGTRRPGFGVTLVSVLLPVVLMLASSIFDIVAPDASGVAKTVIDFLGKPVIALALTVVVGTVVLGRAAGLTRKQLSDSVSSSLPPIAGILLIVGAGGGFKQVLVDTKIGDVIAQSVNGSQASVLLLSWLVAVLIRVATGSATVATITAVGILEPLTAGLSAPEVSLMVLAVGAGSVFLSHVNDAGFWLIKEYFGLSVGETFKSWTVLECVLSVVGLLTVLAIAPIVA